MKIISVQERQIALGSATANAAISFDTMTASAIAVEVETAKGRFTGLGFSSIGRYGHGGLLRERFIPRLMNAMPAEFLEPQSGRFSMQRVWQILMRNEKEGGHGERSGAVGVLETALWDAWAKSEDLPLWALLQREFGHINDNGLPPGQTRIYASGGHYHAGHNPLIQLGDETSQALDDGYGWFKIKIGGASQADDEKRIEAAVMAANDPSSIAVDANCAYNSPEANSILHTLDKMSLRWIEEPVNPLNYSALTATTEICETSIATGENCFSCADADNLLRYGGLRPGRDVLQMDFVLSYGITEYIRMIKIAEELGWNRRSFIPHAGHQAALHVCAGLGLGAHETASQPGPFGGVCDGTRVQHGIAILGDRPGAGIEDKPALYKVFDGLLN